MTSNHKLLLNGSQDFLRTQYDQFLLRAKTFSTPSQSLAFALETVANLDLLLTSPSHQGEKQDPDTTDSRYADGIEYRVFALKSVKE